MNLRLINRIGIEKKLKIEGKAYLLLHEFPRQSPKLIDETKRNYVFFQNGARIFIPKKLIVNELEQTEE